MPQRSRELQPLDTPAAPVLIVGTVLFAVALIVVVLAGGPARWREICGCGIALGLIGAPMTRRRQRSHR
jgi:Protein of unknown function (DUF2530)